MASAVDKTNSLQNLLLCCTHTVDKGIINITITDSIYSFERICQVHNCVQTWHRQTVDVNEQASIQIWDEDQKGTGNLEYIDYLIAYVF